MDHTYNVCHIHDLPPKMLTTNVMLLLSIYMYSAQCKLLLYNAYYILVLVREQQKQAYMLNALPGRRLGHVTKNVFG